jgi:WD40 repeat protein
LRVWRLPDPRSDSECNPNSSGNNCEWNPNSSVNNSFFRYLLTGHTGSVRAIAGQGNVLVSGSYDTNVRVWDLSTGECRFIFQGHQGIVYSVGYCHELKRAVSGSMDATVKIWCTETGDALFTLQGHSSLVGLLELTPNYLISAAADSTLRIWSPIDGNCLGILNVAAITCFHHDPQLNRIVSGSEGGIKIWELSSGGYGKESSLHDVKSIVPSQSNLSKQLHISQGPEGAEPVYGRFIRDVITDVEGVWRVRMSASRLVCAVRREDGSTWFEVLDFSEHADIGARME